MMGSAIRLILLKERGEKDVVFAVFSFIGTLLRFFLIIVYI
jgi:hypothetical protein